MASYPINLKIAPIGGNLLLITYVSTSAYVWFTITDITTLHPLVKRNHDKNFKTVFKPLIKLVRLLEILKTATNCAIDNEISSVYIVCKYLCTICTRNKAKKLTATDSEGGGRQQSGNCLLLLLALQHAEPLRLTL